MVSEDDLPLVYCGGIIKIRCLDADQLPPAMLYALLNTPFVRRQMRNKQFTRDVIDTLGKRFLEVKLPIAKDRKVRDQVAETVSNLMVTRNKSRHTIHDVAMTMYGSIK